MRKKPHWLAGLNLLILGLVLVAPLGSLLLAVFLGNGPTQPSSAPVLVGAQPWLLLGRSVCLALCASALSTLLGLLGGYAVAVMPHRWQPRLMLVMLLPLVIPPFVQALAWIMLAGRLGLSLHGFLMAAGVLGLSFWPLAALLTWAGLKQARGSLLEAGRFCPGRIRVFWRVDLGLIQPHLGAAWLLIFLFSFSDYGVPSLFRVNTYPVFVFSQFAAFYDLRSGVLTSWPYVLLPAVTIWIWRWRADTRLFEVLGKGSSLDCRIGNRDTRPAWAVMGLAVLSVSLVLPLVVLARTAGPLITYITAWNTAHTQITTSLLLATISATAMVVLGFFIALGLRWSRGLSQVLLDYASLLPVALPGTLLGMAMIFLWNRPATQFIYGTLAVVMLLYLARFLPFAARTLLVGLAQIGTPLLEAARLADRSIASVFWRVLLPLLAPAMMVGWGLSFIVSLHELAGTLLVIPPGMETLAVRIYSLYHYGAGNLVAALSLFLVAASVLIFAVTIACYRWIGKR